MDTHATTHAEAAAVLPAEVRERMVPGAWVQETNWGVGGKEHQQGQESPMREDANKAPVKATELVLESTRDNSAAHRASMRDEMRADLKEFTAAMREDTAKYVEAMREDTAKYVEAMREYTAKYVEEMREDTAKRVESIHKQTRELTKAMSRQRVPTARRRAALRSSGRRSVVKPSTNDKSWWKKLGKLSQLFGGKGCDIAPTALATGGPSSTTYVADSQPASPRLSWPRWVTILRKSPRSFEMQTARSREKIQTFQPTGVLARKENAAAQQSQGALRKTPMKKRVTFALP